MNLGLWTRLDILETGEDPRKNLPRHVVEALTEKPDIFINLLRGIGDETAFRIKLIHLQTRSRRSRLGHCPGVNLEMLTEALNAVTGWDFTIDEAMQMGRRTVNLLRVFNYRCGIGSELDAPSSRYGSSPIDGPIAGKSITPHWDNMLSLYYDLMGWDRESGKPLPQTLKELELDHVIPDLWK